MSKQTKRKLRAFGKNGAGASSRRPRYAKAKPTGLGGKPAPRNTYSKRSASIGSSAAAR
jgi:hypothetical protein